jgi:hypothetical protein
MSGGSYDYLCFAEIDKLFEMEVEIQRMGDDLAGLGYAADAAQETHGLLLEIRASRARIEARRKRLFNIWKAMEWWHSGDSGEDWVKDSLKAYRGEV